jgi:hypothetical protein
MLIERIKKFSFGAWKCHCFLVEKLILFRAAGFAKGFLIQNSFLCVKSTWLLKELIRLRKMLRSKERIDKLLFGKMIFSIILMGIFTFTFSLKSNTFIDEKLSVSQQNKIHEIHSMLITSSSYSPSDLSFFCTSKSC